MRIILKRFISSARSVPFSSTRISLNTIIHFHFVSLEIPREIYAINKTRNNGASVHTL